MAKKATDEKALFPILPAGPTGMARLAAQSIHADDGHLIEFREMESRSILNRSVSRRQLWMAWSINPYRGCEFGCKYCYARYTHEFLQPVKASVAAPPRLSEAVQPWALAFEREIYLKANAAWLLEQELKQVAPDEEIALGTATDPYQPIERRTGITRSILEVFARQRGLRLGIVTKSTLIARDIDLLQEIAAKNTLVVHLTITSTDAEFARILEPRAPRPDLRFATLKKLRAAGLRAGVLCSPLLPGLTDNEAALDKVAARAAEADASFLAAQPLFLKSCSRPMYLSFVREHFPHLTEDYARRFARMDFADPEYKRTLSAMVRRVCAKYGLGERSTDALLTRDAGPEPLYQDRKGPKGVRALAPVGAQGLLFA